MPNDDKPRTGKPYIWPTWITGLLAGTNECWWSAWYKAHFRYQKIEDDRGDAMEEWTRQHDAMVTRRAQRLTDEGFLVGVEEENEFKLEGERATLSGKPDIVAREIGSALVVDAKSGKPRDSDVWQVKLYLFVLPMVDPDLRNAKMRGEIHYRDRDVPVTLGALDGAHISNALKIVGGPDEPARVPSARDCRFCDIAHCPDRHVRKVADGSSIF